MAVLLPDDYRPLAPGNSCEHVITGICRSAGRIRVMFVRFIAFPSSGSLCVLQAVGLPDLYRQMQSDMIVLAALSHHVIELCAGNASTVHHSHAKCHCSVNGIKKLHASLLLSLERLIVILNDRNVLSVSRGVQHS